MPVLPADPCPAPPRISALGSNFNFLLCPHFIADVATHVSAVVVGRRNGNLRLVPPRSWLSPLNHAASIHRVLTQLLCMSGAQLLSVLSAVGHSAVTAARLALMSVSPSPGLISIPATMPWAHEPIDYKDKMTRERGQQTSRK